MRSRKKATFDHEEMVNSPVVISVDAGGTTGWSIMQVHPESLVDPDVPILANMEHWAHGQIVSNGPGGKYSKEMEDLAVDELLELAEIWGGAVWVLEDFILRKPSMARELLTPVRLNAVLGYELALMEINIVYQMADFAKRTASDARLKEWLLYERSGGMQHARDADRHSIVLLRRLKEKSAMRGALFPHFYTPEGELKGRVG